MNIEKFNETKRNTAFKLKIYSPFILRDKFSIKLLHKFLGDWEGHTKKSDTIINPLLTFQDFLLEIRLCGIV